MKLVAHINAMLQHMAWADAKVWQLAQSANASDALRPFRERMYHTHLVQHAFATVIGESEFVMVKPEEFKRDADLMGWGRENITELLRLGVESDPVTLETTVELPWFEDPAFRPTRLQAFTQAAMHTQHHRGQALLDLKAAGVTLESVDYIFWLKLGTPKPDWPA